MCRVVTNSLNFGTGSRVRKKKLGKKHWLQQLWIYKYICKLHQNHFTDLKSMFKALKRRHFSEYLHSMPIPRFCRWIWIQAEFQQQPFCQELKEAPVKRSWILDVSCASASWYFTAITRYVSYLNRAIRELHNTPTPQVLGLTVLLPLKHAYQVNCFHLLGDVFCWIDADGP